jgi:hypothetical protein
LTEINVVLAHPSSLSFLILIRTLGWRQLYHLCGSAEVEKEQERDALLSTALEVRTTSSTILYMYTYPPLIKDNHIPWNKTMEGAFELPSRDHAKHITHQCEVSFSAPSSHAREKCN